MPSCFIGVAAVDGVRNLQTEVVAMIAPRSPYVLVAPAARREAGDVKLQLKSAEQRILPREARIDEVVMQSFPASDPPSWNMGVANPDAWR